MFPGLQSMSTASFMADVRKSVCVYSQIDTAFDRCIHMHAYIYAYVVYRITKQYTPSRASWEDSG